MKLDLYRYSGKIMDPEQEQAFLQEWGPIYDKVMARIEAIHQDRSNRLFLLPSHVLSTRMCGYMERLLLRKYQMQIEVDLPTNAKQWKALIERYGRMPIMVGLQRDSTKLVLVIADNING